MKYVVFSFDDGRKDFFSNVMPILKKYGIVATVNVISDYIGSHAPRSFLSGNNEFMTLQEIREVHEYGIEIGNHTVTHSNELPSVVNFKLGDERIDCEGYGFASPESVICNKNIDAYYSLVESGIIKYIRSGRQIKRDGLLYAFFYVLLGKIKSKYLFWFYQKRNIISILKNYKYYPSLSIESFNTAEQIIYLIKKMKDEQAVIFMFHSILERSDKGYGKDKWFNDVSLFESVCKFCIENEDIQIITNRALFELQNSLRG